MHYYTEANKRMKRCSTSLADREMKIKSTRRYDCTSLRKAKMKYVTTNTSKDVEKLDHPYIADLNVKSADLNVQPVWKIVSFKTKNEFTI